jgi:arginine decarboxylase
LKNKYINLIEQTFDFPQAPFEVNSVGHLFFHGIDLTNLAEVHGTPLKLTYLPVIGDQISKVVTWFNKGMNKVHYKANYHFCYCTKSNHFKHTLEEVLKNGAHIETSSGFDIDLIQKLHQSGHFDKQNYVISNGYKLDDYILKIIQLTDQGFENVIPVMDNAKELERFQKFTNKDLKIGIRIASEEEPKFPFYTSRLGIGYQDIVPFYNEKIKGNKQVQLKMLHFFINTGIEDDAYYWNELHKCLKVYCELKKVNKDLTALNIGGGFPIKNSLSHEYDYEYMVHEIVYQIKTVCESHGVPEPDIFTEFGSFTVGEAGANIYQVKQQKSQNDREKWNMIDSSFMTTLPDTWALNKKFIMLATNRWHDTYERILLGGITCDSDDYYNSEQHSNAIFLPVFEEHKPLYFGFFNTAAYQDSLSGFGGLQHCLTPSPKHLVVDKIDGELKVDIFKEGQSAEEMLTILGFDK